MTHKNNIKSIHDVDVPRFEQNWTHSGHHSGDGYVWWYVSVTPDFQLTHVVHPVMAPFRTVGVRDPFYNRFMRSWYESCKNVCCSNKKKYHQISSHICTCHDISDSSAVVTCTKLWPGWILKSLSGTSNDCYRSMMTSSNGNIFRVTSPLCG